MKKGKRRGPQDAKEDTMTKPSRHYLNREQAIDYARQQQDANPGSQWDAKEQMDGSWSPVRWDAEECYWETVIPLLEDADFSPDRPKDVCPECRGTGSRRLNPGDECPVCRTGCPAAN